MKLEVRDYREKFWFLVGHKPNEPHGRLRDLTAELQRSNAPLSQHQLWVTSLSVFIQTVPLYLLACERAEDSTGALQLSQLKDGTPEIATNTHANWAAASSRGPEESVGAAAAALYGCGCPEDDPALPLPERRTLWNKCDHTLWLSWRNDSAADFVTKYAQALKLGRLAFPKHILTAMRGQSTHSPAPPPPLPQPSPQHPARAPWPRRALRWGGALAAAMLLFASLAALRLPPPPKLLASASTWIECMPGAGMVTLGTGSDTTQLPCPDNGLLPVDDMIASPSTPLTVAQSPFTATFAPQTISAPFWQRTLWRPSPSFAEMLHRRGELHLSLDCTSGPAEIVFDNPSWGPRRLTCATPSTQIPRLEPADLQLSVTVTKGPAGPLSCSGFFPPQQAEPLRINPAEPCAKLAQGPLPRLPVKPLLDGLDMVEDPATGLVWLTDPLLFGSAWERQAEAEWNFKELLQKVQQLSDGQVWRLARPQEVMLADPALFRIAAGGSTELGGVAKDAACKNSWRKVILSLTPERSSADANQTIQLPCLIKDPDLGFWLVQNSAPPGN